MKAFHPRSASSVKVAASKLFRLERSGRYEAALGEFGNEWRAVAYLPDTTGLTRSEASELLLRFGALVGFYSYQHQLATGQDRSKDILTAARRGFEELGEREKTAECDCYLALAYWRTYEYREALAWIEGVSHRDLPPTSKTQLFAHVAKSLILLSQKRYAESIDLCLSTEAAMRRFGDAFLNGSLSTNIGLSYKNLGDTVSAMRYLTLARHFHELSGHKPYLGTVQNNLAQLHKEERRFHLAHESADAAIKTYRRIKDRAREASTLDTKAQIYIAESRFIEAQEVASASIAMLRDAGNTAFLAESLMTRSTARLRSDNIPGALDDLIEAVNITKQQDSDESADHLIAGFANEMKRCVELCPSEGSVEAADMELELPPSLSQYSSYKGLWINTPHLEYLGVPQGSLAVVTPVEPKRGDLVALSENTGGAISCGVYDYEFGIVCIDRSDGEPLLFDKDDVEVLGKIIGYGEMRDADGKMQIKALA